MTILVCLGWIAGAFTAIVVYLMIGCWVCELRNEYHDAAWFWPLLLLGSLLSGLLRGVGFVFAAWLLIIFASLRFLERWGRRLLRVLSFESS